MTTEAVFYKQPTVLAQNLQNFWPEADMNFTQRVNAMVRLVLYACGIMYVYNRKPVYLAYAAVSILILGYVYASTDTSTSVEGFVGAADSRQCTRPTSDNPFMNKLVFDDPTRPPPCDPFETRDETRKLFNDGLWRNATDVWQRENSQREYYTLPNGGVVPSTKKFAEFLYGGPNSSGRKLYI